MEQFPSYYAILTPEVRYCKSIEPGAKILYAEITCLTHNPGFSCYATNNHFSELFDVDVRTIQRWLTSLKDNGFIFIDLEKKGMITTRKIYISKEKFTTRQNCHDGMSDSSPRDDKNAIHNSKDNNKDNCSVMSVTREREKKIFSKNQKNELISKTYGEIFDILSSQKCSKEEIDEAITIMEKKSPRVTKIESYLLGIIKNKQTKEDENEYNKTRSAKYKNKASPTQRKIPTKTGRYIDGILDTSPVRGFTFQE